MRVVSEYGDSILPFTSLPHRRWVWVCPFSVKRKRLDYAVAAGAASGGQGHRDIYRAEHSLLDTESATCSLTVCASSWPWRWAVWVSPLTARQPGLREMWLPQGHTAKKRVVYTLLSPTALAATIVLFCKTLSSVLFPPLLGFLLLDLSMPTFYPRKLQIYRKVERIKSSHIYST